MEKQSKIIEIVEKVAGKPVKIAADESLFDSGLLDSFSLNDVVTALEKEFQIKVPDQDLNPRKFDSIEKIVNYLETRS